MAGRSGVGQSLATLGLGCLLSRPTDVPHGQAMREYGFKPATATLQVDLQPVRSVWGTQRGRGWLAN
ncbi:MAG: hypothetical protein ACK44Q_18215, partial [Pirellulaceae bacterium]